MEVEAWKYVCSYLLDGFKAGCGEKFVGRHASVLQAVGLAVVLLHMGLVKGCWCGRFQGKLDCCFDSLSESRGPKACSCR